MGSIRSEWGNESDFDFPAFPRPARRTECGRWRGRRLHRNLRRWTRHVCRNRSSASHLLRRKLPNPAMAEPLPFATDHGPTINRQRTNSSDIVPRIVIVPAHPRRSGWGCRTSRRQYGTHFGFDHPLPVSRVACSHDGSELTEKRRSIEAGRETENASDCPLRKQYGPDRHMDDTWHEFRPFYRF